jgi:outer membrane murein-binding lipoprotein Lpp
MRLLRIAAAPVIVLLALVPRLARGDCATMCSAHTRALDEADLAYDANTGRIVRGSSELPASSNVTVAVLDMNPFRYEYRVEVSAEVAASRLIQDVFGGYAPSPGLPVIPAARGTPRTLAPGVEATKPGDCTAAQEKVIAVIGEADAADDAPYLEHPRAFVEDAGKFREVTKVETLPRATCAAVCESAERLRDRRLHWDLDAVTKAHDRVASLAVAARGAAGALHDQTNKCADYVSARVRDLDARQAEREKDWNEVAPALRTAQEELRRLDAILRSVLAREDAFANSRVQNTPSDASIVRVNLYRRDLTQVDGAEGLVTSSEVRVGRSPISFSIGLGVMGLTDRRAVRSAAPRDGGTVATVFALDVESQFTPSVVGLLNVRVLGGSCKLLRECGLAVSAGIQPAGDPKRLRYLIAPSFAFMDGVALVSVGAAIGQIERIGGGFAVGDEVPEGLLELPVRQDWEVGLFGAFTYRIR